MLRSSTFLVLAGVLGAVAVFYIATDPIIEPLLETSNPQSDFPFIFVAFSLLLYLSPTIIAYRRKHSKREAIMMLNLVGGWTVIGWIAAFVWAHTEKEKEGEKSN